MRRTARAFFSTSPRPALSLALVAASITFTSAARGDVRLTWEAPPECPERGEVLDRISALVGSSLDQTEGLSVEGKIERASGRFWLTLLVGDGREVRTRVIASDSCADLAGAAAVTLALLLGIEVRSTEPGSTADAAVPGTAGGANDTKPPGDERPKPSVTPATKPPPSPPDDSSSTRRWAFVVRAPVGTVDLGPLPKPTVGVGLGVGARYESFSFLLSGHVSKGQTIDAPEFGAGVGADLDRMTAELVTCRGFRWGKFEVAPCVAVAVEYVTAQGFGDSVVPRAQRAVWPALGAGGIAHVHALESLAFFVGATGYVELSRPHLVIDGVGEVGTLTPLAAGATLGLEWIL